MLVETHRALASIKCYETTRIDLSSGQVIGSSRRLPTIEKAFRMSEADLKARPIYHPVRLTIHVHLTVMMAAMAVGHLVGQHSGLSLKRLTRTLKLSHTLELIIAGQTTHVVHHPPAPIEIHGPLEKVNIQE